MRLRWIIFSGVLLSACGAASDVESSAPDTVGLFDQTTTSVASDAVNSEADGVEATSTSELDSTATDGESTDGESTATATATATAAAGSTQTTAPSTTALAGSTVPATDTNAAFCRAALAIADLGTLIALDDTDAANTYFEAQADRWNTAAGVAPAEIKTDTRTVATFVGDLRTLLAANDFDLFAAFQEATELETATGSDLARVRVDQFIFANCEVTPPRPEQATAAFYGRLLGSADDRAYLAELLASAEVFSLDGARCFVDRATPDVMHPLVGAPATPAQDAALAGVLTACQMSIGTGT